MQPEIAKFLHDVLIAGRLIEDFTRGKTFPDYERDALLRAGVEREFITIGEALMQAMKLDPASVQSISCLRQVIGFRNVLVHGYTMIRHATVWGIVENDLGELLEQVGELLRTANGP